MATNNAMTIVTNNKYIFLKKIALQIYIKILGELSNTSNDDIILIYFFAFVKVKT